MEKRSRFFNIINHPALKDWEILYGVKRLGQIQNYVSQRAPK